MDWSNTNLRKNRAFCSRFLHFLFRKITSRYRFETSAPPIHAQNRLNAPACVRTCSTATDQTDQTDRTQPNATGRDRLRPTATDCNRTRPNRPDATEPTGRPTLPGNQPAVPILSGPNPTRSTGIGRNRPNREPSILPVIGLFPHRNQPEPGHHRPNQSALKTIQLVEVAVALRSRRQGVSARPSERHRTRETGKNDTRGCFFRFGSVLLQRRHPPEPRV